MQKIDQIAQLPGVNDLFSLVTFLADKKAGLEYLKKLEDLRADLNQRMKDMGIGKDIAAARNQADTFNYEAKKALAAAHQESDKIIAATKAKRAELEAWHEGIKKTSRDNTRDDARIRKERTALDSDRKAHDIKVANDKDAFQKTSDALDKRAEMLASKVETLNAMKKAL